MSKGIIEIDESLKNQIGDLLDLDDLEVDDRVLKILDYYKELVRKKDEEINELKKYKERELTAFAIGDAISDGICLVNSSGVVISINKGYTEITGIQESEIVGKHLSFLLEKGYFTTEVSTKVIEKKKKISLLSTILRNNKKVLITGNPIFDKDGRVVQVLTVMRDLTELLKLKEKLEKAEKESEKYLNELNYFRNKHIVFSGMIGENVQMKKIRELINYVAGTDSTILITGETGSGKEVVAREIYSRSNRKDAPYIKVNCAAIPDTLMESELFGYEKGAFTGAQNKEKIGMFEAANRGTILLDEISEIPLNLQAKLLRVLQEKEIMRVGGTKTIKLDVRVIATANKDLFQLVQRGLFREDLYYRLNVVPIRIPPLRDRKDDIALLAYNFLEKFNIKYGKKKVLDSSALHALESYDWPGNVRELENVIERLVVIDDNSYITFNNIMSVIGKNITSVDLSNRSQTLSDAVKTLEKEMIQRALDTYGSTYKAARALGITQPTVFRKARAYGIKLNNARVN